MEGFTTYPDDWRTRLCGAYIIVHSPSGRTYVGSTGNLFQRRCEHLSDLRNNQHRNNRLQEAFNVNPVIEFFAIVTSDERGALNIEQDILDRYADSGILFNLSLNAQVAFKGLTHTAQTKQQISLSKTGQGRGVAKTAEHKAKIGIGNAGKKPAAQTIAAVVAAKSQSVSIDGIPYSSLSEAARKLNLTPSTVHGRINSESLRFRDWKYA